MEDHYSTLGVAETASQEEIKSAYRKLAMQYHPDRNPGNASAEEQFKKINAAYAAVGEPDARAQYDQMRKFGGQQGNPFGQGGFEFNFGFGHDINDIINQFFGQAGFAQAHARPQRNRDFSFNLHLTLEEAFTGKQTPVQFNVNGQDYNLNVTIPAGIDNGTRIRYQGHGDKSIPNIPPGDLYIQVHILEHNLFKRNGPHLFSEIVIDALDAIVGCDLDFTCIDGQSIKISVPPGTQPGHVVRLRERGMPTRAGGHPRGDCNIVIHVKVPTDLSDDDKNKIKTIINGRKS